MRENWRGPQLGMWLCPRRRTHYALGLALGMERRCGDWSKTQFAQSVFSGQAAILGNGSWGIREGNGEERSPASGYVVSRRIDGNCASTMRVRSGVAGRPVHVETAVPLSVFNSYAAVVGKQPELVVRSNRRV